MLSVTDISAIIAVAGVLAGIGYYIIALRNQTKLKRTDTLIRLYELTSTKELQEPFWLISSINANDYEEYAKEYGSPFQENSNKSIHLALWKVLSVYDLIGSLLYKGLLDIDLVHLSLSVNVTLGLHKRLSPIVQGLRKGMNEPNAFSGFDYLAGELAKNEDKLRKDVERMRE